MQLKKTLKIGLIYALKILQKVVTIQVPYQINKYGWSALGGYWVGQGTIEWLLVVLGKYQKNVRTKQSFNSVLNLKPSCKVFCNVRTKPLKPLSNVYLYFIETSIGYYKKLGLGFQGLELIRQLVLSIIYCLVSN